MKHFLEDESNFFQKFYDKIIFMKFIFNCMKNLNENIVKKILWMRILANCIHNTSFFSELTNGPIS